MSSLISPQQIIATSGPGSSFKSKLSNFLIGLVVIGIGILVGYNLVEREAAWTTVSILVIFVVVATIVIKPLYGLFAWIFFHAFIETWIKIPMGAGIPDLSFSRFTIAFLLIIMLARGSIGKFRFLPISLTDICIIAATIGIMVSASLSYNPREVIMHTVVMHFTPLVIYFLAKNFVRDKEDLLKLFWVIALLGFASAAYGIYEQTTDQVLFQAQTRTNNGLDDYSATLGIIQGFVGSNNIGRILTVSIPISFYLFFESKSINLKMLLVGMITVQSYGMFLTLNRTSWYGLLISLTIIQFFYPQFRRVFWVIVCVSAVVLFATWNQVNQSDVVQNRINSNVSTLDAREELWRTGYNMWLAKPIRGWGADGYRTQSGRFRTDGKRKNFQQPENDFIKILVATGLVGFLPYFIYLVAPFVNSLRLVFKARAPDWPGFIKAETITIYWAVIISFIIGSYSQVQVTAIVKMLPFVVAGAVIGSHEHLLRGLKKKIKQHLPLGPPVTPVVVEHR